jgi:hypothetical protein
MFVDFVAVVALSLLNWRCGISLHLLLSFSPSHPQPPFPTSPAIPTELIAYRYFDARYQDQVQLSLLLALEDLTPSNLLCVKGVPLTSITGDSSLAGFPSTPHPSTGAIAASYNHSSDNAYLPHTSSKI